MNNLNDSAAQIMTQFSISACTDVTGYGLLGHLFELCQGSQVSVRLTFNNIPFLKGVYELAQKGFIPSGTKRNLDFVHPDVNFSDNFSQEEKFLMADAQTSGGLLISVGPENLDKLTKNLDFYGISNYAVIGEMTSRKESSLHITVN